MFINELNIGTELLIEVTDKQNSLNFSTIIKSANNEKDQEYLDIIAEKLRHAPMVLIDKVIYEEKVVNFEGSGFICNVSTTFEDKPFLWQNVRIPKVTLPSGETTHLLIAIDNIEPYNRRAEYRCFLGIEGYLRVGDSRSIHNALVRDISNSGVGFILSDDTVVKQGDIVNVSWYDGHYSTTRKEIVDVLYKVDAHVVRVIPMNNNRRLIGCILDEPSNTISKYVMLKQRERLQAQRSQLRKKP